MQCKSYYTYGRKQYQNFEQSLTSKLMQNITTFARSAEKTFFNFCAKRGDNFFQLLRTNFCEPTFANQLSQQHILTLTPARRAEVGLLLLLRTNFYKPIFANQFLRTNFCEPTWAGRASAEN